MFWHYSNDVKGQSESFWIAFKWGLNFGEFNIVINGKEMLLCSLNSYAHFIYIYIFYIQCLYLFYFTLQILFVRLTTIISLVQLLTVNECKMNAKSRN